jgi:hypothetical protein
MEQKLPKFQYRGNPWILQYLSELFALAVLGMITPTKQSMKNGLMVVTAA